ncbi:MAG: BatA domain-containing protein [Bryobacterales bacterium]|nr:BatA domain-containing protein [Bryobacterales bacterium]
MGLLSPWFLAGMGLLGLPLYLHLLKRHKSVPEQFSSLMFFEKSMQANLKHRRLDFLLLLAMRLALLTLIVLAFAQPFLTRHGAIAGAQIPRLIVIDDSASMGAGNRMERARSEAASLITEGAKVATFDSQMRLITVADIAGLQAGTARSSLGELARALRAYQESVKTPLEVHLISDLQLSSMPAGFSDLRLNADIKLVLHPLADKAEPNWTVDSVTAPSRVRDGKGAKVQATVAGFHTDAATKVVTLEVNGREIARQSVLVPAGGRVKVEFNGLDIPYGFAKCAVTVQGGDTLASDDRYLFAVERTDPQRVVFQYGERSTRSVLYFRNALEAATAGAYQVEATPISQDVNYDRASFVVLSDVGQFNDAALRRYVERGGSALVILGPLSVAAGKAPVTGELIKASRYNARAGDRYQTLGSADDSYPPIGRAARWEAVRFYQSVELEPKTSRVLARLTDQTPILLEQKIGEGTVVLFASSLDNVANDFPVQPAFVPFVEQLAHRLSGWEEASLNVMVDSALDFKTSAGSRSFEAMDPDGNRALSYQESSKGAPLILSRAGFWEIRRGAGKAQMLAANIDRRESDLAPMPEESAQLWQSPVAGQQSGSSSTRESESRWPLAAWILGAAAVAGLLEAVVSSRHLSREAA